MTFVIAHPFRDLMEGNEIGLSRKVQRQLSLNVLLKCSSELMSKRALQLIRPGTSCKISATLKFCVGYFAHVS